MNLSQIGPGAIVRPDVVTKEDLIDPRLKAGVANDLAEFTETLLDTRIPEGRTINNIPIDRDIILLPVDFDTYDRGTIDQKIATVAAGGYNPVQVNGHLLDRNVSLDANDLGAYTATEIDGKLALVPVSRTVNGKALNADIVLAPGDVGAYTKTEVDTATGTIVPATRKINGKPLSSDVTLTAGDVGAPAIADVVPRSFTINGQPMTGDMTVSLDAAAYTKAEIDTKLTDYIKTANVWGLGPAAPTVTANLDIKASGFYGYTGTLSNPPTGSTKGTILAIATGDDTTPGLSAIGFPEDLDYPLFYRNSKWEKAGGKGGGTPIPDVWIPFTDSLRMLTGDAPWDTITVNGQSVDLNTKSVTFTRASTATYISRDGILRSAAVDEPRFEKGGLLMEGQSTNYVATQTVAPVASYLEVMSAQESPDGGTNGQKIKSLAMPILTKSFAYVSGDLTASWFFKPVANATYLPVLFRNDTTATELQRDDLSIDGNGNPVLSNPTFSTITKLNNGWYRHTLTQPADARMRPGDTITVYFGLIGNDSTGREYLLYGMQIEPLPAASSYIPTSGATATRAGDVCFVKAPDNFKKADYTISLNADFNQTATYPRRRRVYACTEFYTWAYEAVAGSSDGYVYLGENIYTALPKASLANLDKPFVVRMEGDTGIASMYNGSLLVQKAINVVADLGTDIYFGGWNNEYLYGHIRNVRIWHTPLTDDQIGGLV